LKILSQSIIHQSLNLIVQKKYLQLSSENSVQLSKVGPILSILKVSYCFAVRPTAPGPFG